MAKAEKEAPKDQRQLDRDAELELQKKVQDAVDAVTRDKNGDPVPLP